VRALQSAAARRLGIRTLSVGAVLALAAPAVKGDLTGASIHYNRALAALRTGDWAQFGSEMQQLGTELGHPSDSGHH